MTIPAVNQSVKVYPPVVFWYTALARGLVKDAFGIGRDVYKESVDMQSICTVTEDDLYGAGDEGT